MEKSRNDLLLHICCAPCSCAVIEYLLHYDITPSLYFYNPNIHPKEEYEIRKAEVIRYAKKKNLLFYDDDYDPEKWFQETQGLELEKERGQRCFQCFFMRFLKTCAFAKDRGFPLISSTLSVSSWKSSKQILEAGSKAAALFPGVSFWDIDWKKFIDPKVKKALIHEENFYRQTYCGCIYSKRS